MSTEKATINFAVALSDPTTSLAYQYEVKVKCNNTELGRFAVIDKYNYGDIDIINPELWWPNGIGKPFIYDFVVELVQSISNQVIDYRKIPYGIRSV